MMMEDEQQIHILFECPYCGTVFSKNNKPLIMKCTHSICQQCTVLNSNKLICLTCQKVYEGKANKKHPINFLLLEIIDKTTKETPEKEKSKHKGKHRDSKASLKMTREASTEKDVLTSLDNPDLTYYCNTCETTFPNQFHLEKYPSHQMKEDILKTPQEQMDLLKKKSVGLMEKYKSFNDTMENYHNQFFSFVFDFFEKNQNVILDEMESHDNLDNLMMCGVINPADKERISEFLNQMRNEEIKNIILNASSFEDLFENRKKIEMFNKFLSNFFYCDEIYQKKLSRTDSIIRDLSNKIISNDQDFSSVFKRFSEDLSVQIYEDLKLDRDIRSNFKLPYYILKSNKILVFDTLTESLKSFSLPEVLTSFLQYSHSLDGDYKLYITGGLASQGLTTLSEAYYINLKEDCMTLLNLKNLSEAKCNHSSIIINRQLYVIGGVKNDNTFSKSCDRLSLDDVSNSHNNSWHKCASLPHEIKIISLLLNYGDEYIYALQDLKNIIYYSIEKDKWTVCKPLYEDSFNLTLHKFTAMSAKENEIIILGGIINEIDQNKISDNIFCMSHSKTTIGIVGSLGIMEDENSKLETGFFRDKQYILQINEEKKNLKLFKVKDISKYLFEETAINENNEQHFN